MDNRTYTLTFGDQAENHVGMQQIGKMAESGFSVKELQKIFQKVTNNGFDCEFCDLSEYGESAGVLVIRNGCEMFGVTADDLMAEQDGLCYDTKAYMYGRVVNKKARHNICFSQKEQEPDYVNKKGSIVSYSSVPKLKKLRKMLKYFGPKAKNMKIEGNYYYNSSKCGIGYHGDSERRRVIGLRLGDTLPICYQWYHKRVAIGKKVTIYLNHGDMYIMSEKAVGTDWKKSSIYTLRHAAGCTKYTNVN